MDGLLDFGTAALAEQQREAEAVKRRAAEEAAQQALFDRLMGDAASTRDEVSAGLADKAARRLQDQQADAVRQSLASRLATRGPMPMTTLMGDGDLAGRFSQGSQQDRPDNAPRGQFGPTIPSPMTLSDRGPVPMAAMVDDRKDRSNLASGAFAMTPRPKDAPSGRYAAPIPSAKMRSPTATERRAIAADGPNSPLDANGHTQPLRDQLMSIERLVREGTDGGADNEEIMREFEQRNKSRAESAAQKQWRAEDNEAERFASARRRSQATQKRGTDARMREPNSGPSDLVREALLGYGNAQRMASPNAGRGNAYAAAAGSTRQNAIDERARQEAQAASRDEELATEFADRKQRMADPNRELSVFAKMAKGSARPQNLTASQSQAIADSKTRGAQTSARLLAALMAGRSGKELSAADLQDPAVAKAYATGSQQGPTLAQAMAFQRDQGEARRAQAERGQILQQVEAYQRFLADPNLAQDKRAAYQSQLDILLGLLAAAPRNFASLPQVRPVRTRPNPPAAPVDPEPARVPGVGGLFTHPGAAWAGQAGMMPR